MQLEAVQLPIHIFMNGSGHIGVAKQALTGYQKQEKKSKMDLCGPAAPQERSVHRLDPGEISDAWQEANSMVPKIKSIFAM